MKYLEDVTVSASISKFENPTIPFLEKTLNLDEILIHSPSSTHIISSPNQLLSRGIARGDWLVVNADLTPRLGDVVYAVADDVYGITTFEYIKAKCSSGIHESISIVGVIQQSIHFYRGEQTIPDHNSLIELSIHSALIEKEHTTVLAKASGDSMLPHVCSGDLMLIERHLDWHDGDVCVVALNGDLALKRVNSIGRTLSSDNPKFKPHFISSADSISIEGVVNKVIKVLRPPCTA